MTAYRERRSIAGFTREQIELSARDQRSRQKSGEVDVTVTIVGYLKLCDMALQSLSPPADRKAALEEAAKLCDAERELWESHHDIAANTADRCAALIRALADQETK